MELGRSLGMTIHRQIALNDTYRARALERLSSGVRINRAADDAGGLSISETMTSGIRGTHQAIRNLQDGINLVRTAEGAFNEIHAMLQRMRELSVQGANGTLTASDRLGIQEEIEQIKRQIDTTAYTTSFNGLKLLVDQNKVMEQTPMPYNYSLAPAGVGAWGTATAAEVLLGGPGGTNSGVTWQNLLDVKAQLPSLIQGALSKAEGMLIDSGLDQSIIVPTPNIYFVIDSTKPAQFTSSNANNIAINLYSFYGAGVPAGNPQLSLQQAVAQAMGNLLVNREDQSTGNTTDYTSFLATTGTYDNLRQLTQMAAGENYNAYPPPASFQFDSLDADGGRGASAAFSRFLIANYGQDALDQIASLIVNDESGSKASIATSLDTYLQTLTGLGSKAAIEGAVQTWLTANPTVSVGVTSSLSNTSITSAQLLAQPIVLQAGAAFSDTFNLNLYAGAAGNLDFTALVAVTDEDTARRSIGTLDKAIAQVSDARAHLGAQETELSLTIDRLGGYEEELSSANSRIRDTDMAETVADLSRRDILAQTGMATLENLHTLQRERAGTLLSSLDAQSA